MSVLGHFGLFKMSAYCMSTNLRVENCGPLKTSGCQGKQHLQMSAHV